MKPSIAEAKKAKAAEEMVAIQNVLKAQMDSIEAKLDALLKQKAAPKQAAEK